LIGEPRTPEFGRPVIVVGYDASDEAREALAVASQRAGRHGTALAVHAVRPASDHLGAPYFQRAVDAAHLKGRARLASIPVSNDPDGPIVETDMLEGKPARVLTHVARVHGAREIVVGSRRLGRLRALLGSVSRRVLAMADRPVVVVPRREVTASESTNQT
jgi:nucleotide-binding universal stress UspA family protein